MTTTRRIGVALRGRPSIADRLPFAHRFMVARRRSATLWAVGVAAYCALIAAFYPTVRESDSFARVLEDYPEPVRELLGDAALDLTSGSGFLHAEVFSIVGPLLLSIVAIGVGASLASDEQSGFMDLIFANSVTRGRFVAERAVAMVIAVVQLSLVMLVALAIADPLIESDVGFGPLVMSVLAAGVFAMVFGAIALTVAAQTGDRSAAVGLAVAAFAVAYLVSAAAELVDWLEPIRIVSPYYWLVARSALLGRSSVPGLGSWIVFVAALTIVAAWMLERRDLR